MYLKNTQDFLCCAQSLRHVQVFVTPMDCSPSGSFVHGDSPGKNTGVGCHAFLQGIFLAQGSNPGLPHCRQILYQLSHQGSPRYWSGQPSPSLGDLPDPEIKLGSPALQVYSLPAELPGYVCLGSLYVGLSLVYHNFGIYKRW